MSNTLPTQAQLDQIREQLLERKRKEFTPAPVVERVYVEHKKQTGRPKKEPEPPKEIPLTTGQKRKLKLTAMPEKHPDYTAFDSLADYRSSVG